MVNGHRDEEVVSDDEADHSDERRPVGDNSALDERKQTQIDFYHDWTKY